MNFLQTITHPENFNNIRIFGTNDNPWFMAKDIAVFLGYRNPQEAVRNHVDEEDKCILENIRVRETLPLSSQSKSILINESGLYSLICRSKKPEAKKFKRWVTSEVLPSIRTNGGYILDINTQKKSDEELRQLKISNVNAIRDLMEKIGMDDRDRVLLADTTRNLLVENKNTVIPVEETKKEMSVSRRLLENFNYNRNNAKILIQIGRTMAKKYRELYGKEPLKRESFVGGTMRKINYYTVEDFEEFGDYLIEKILDN
jgi:prophage antirepressor-like protein